MRVTAFATLAAALVAGCAAAVDRDTFFALSDGGAVIGSTPAATSASNGAGSTPSTLPGVVISAVSIPELVDRPQIVTRDNANRVVVSENHLWAESIKSGIGRTLATRLSRALADAGQPAQVAAYPQSSIADPALRITVDVVRFDAVPNGEAVVDALWSIRRPSDGTIRNGRTVASSPIAGTSYEAIVGAWNDAVATVDRDIADAVVQAGVDRPSAPGPVAR